MSAPLVADMEDLTSAHFLLNLLNELRKRDKNARLVEHFISFVTSLINSLIQEHEC